MNPTHCSECSTPLIPMCPNCTPTSFVHRETCGKRYATGVADERERTLRMLRELRGCSGAASLLNSIIETIEGRHEPA